VAVAGLVDEENKLDMIKGVCMSNCEIGEGREEG
jgi:hypothetical protein